MEVLEPGRRRTEGAAQGVVGRHTLRATQEMGAHPWGWLTADDTGGRGDLTAVASGVCGAFSFILRAAGWWRGWELRASFYPPD